MKNKNKERERERERRRRRRRRNGEPTNMVQWKGKTRRKEKKRMKEAATISMNISQKKIKER